MNHHRRSAQVWRVFSRDLTVLPAHPHVHPLEWPLKASRGFVSISWAFCLLWYGPLVWLTLTKSVFLFFFIIGCYIDIYFTHFLSLKEPYLPLHSQPQLVLIYRPWRDGRLSRPWCEVAPTEIRTFNGEIQRGTNCFWALCVNCLAIVVSQTNPGFMKGGRYELEAWKADRASAVDSLR